LPIVHVINRLVPGGAENQLREITGRSRLDAEVVELQPGPMSRVATIRRLRHLIGGRRPGVIVAWLDRSQLAVALVASRSQRLVAAIGGMPRRTGPAGWQLRLAFTRFDRFVSNSRISRAATVDFARPFTLPHFDVIPNGVSVPVATERHENAITRIGFIGRDDPAKGLDVMLAALERANFPVEAVFVGEGVPAAVETRAPSFRHETYPRVTDPWSLVGSVDVVVVPSRSEGSPNVVIEAFARKIPVVATTAGGIPELVQDERALAVAPDDPGALAEALRRVIAEPEEARRRAERAYSYAVEKHAWERVVDAWDTLLEEELAQCG
jgi:glycosyltransferase involved in cell wall biosynthesis